MTNCVVRLRSPTSQCNCWWSGV